MEAFNNSKNLEVIQIIENKASLKSNVIITIGELVKSISTVAAKKVTSPRKPPLIGAKPEA